MAQDEKNATERIERKFLIDSDGLIKLCKCKALQIVAKSLNCTISHAIYEETVEEGMKRFYEDAFEIEGIVKKEMISVVKGEVVKEGRLGKGECSILYLYEKGRYDAIICDDLAFLKILDAKSIPYIIPTDVIVLLNRQRKIRQGEASEFLEKLRELTREEAYLKSLAKLVRWEDERV